MPLTATQFYKLTHSARYFFCLFIYGTRHTKCTNRLGSARPKVASSGTHAAPERKLWAAACRTRGVQGSYGLPFDVPKCVSDKAAIPHCVLTPPYLMTELISGLEREEEKRKGGVKLR